MIWRADYDPGALYIEAIPARDDDPERVELTLLGRWLTAVSDCDGIEHAVLSDGRHHIRLEVAGTLNVGHPVLLRYHLAGILGLDPMILTLRRFLHLHRHRRFSASLFPREARVARWVLLLRVHDALADGASHREIGVALFGADRVVADWAGGSDSLRSRVRRLVADARKMAAGGYRGLMRPQASERRPGSESPDWAR